MLGIKYYRLMENRTQEDMAATLGIGAPLYISLEKDKDTQHKASLYIDLSRIFGASVDDLIREYPDEILASKHNAKPKQHEPVNCIGVYMQINNHTLRSMRGLLGVSYQMVRVICARSEVAQKYIQKLADVEGISKDEFEQKYGKDS